MKNCSRDERSKEKNNNFSWQEHVTCPEVMFMAVTGEWTRARTRHRAESHGPESECHFETHTDKRRDIKREGQGGYRLRPSRALPPPSSTSPATRPPIPPAEVNSHRTLFSLCSPSKAIVSGDFSDSTMKATATTGRLPFPMLTRTNYVA
ncbi:hypothetical protein E2562_024548 [Oryza meyeriana var. granulata]|uniref:Uncharacterized protein n=1 Tax=Oryza meyeriana var. granulata TaxID=110450 RepID=A0A6G1BQ27_9ORYZ|nr:hypothetical protein E2562_024548 [Oryza meyeriana var. granulata]